ncbi:MazG-like family protein [Francisellaceae bacterium CB300]|jgi:NTP pyrophosphatase (non-canonical NTP hydrolase)
MSIKNAQQTVAELFKNITHPRLGSFIALTEEVGELANEIMKKEIYEETNHNDKIKAEMTDVLVCLLELANLYDVDLETEFDKKIKSLTPRVKEWQSIKDILKAKRNKLD